MTKVSDPHPDNEEHYRQQRRPGGSNPPRKDIGPNDAVHDGKAPPKPAHGSKVEGQKPIGTRS